MYRYEPCNVGNIRKMVIVMPRVEPVLGPQDQQTYNGIRDQPETIYKFASKFTTMGFEAKVWRPIKEQEQMQNVFLREGSSNADLTVFVDNPPQWNPSKKLFRFVSDLTAFLALF